MEHITINSDRSVTVPIELRKIGVQYDHNVNTIEFVGPRYSSNVDLSTMTIYINYILSDKTPGKYKAENVIIDDQDDSLIRFNWTITRNVTKVSGILSCLVCAKKTDEEGNEINHWNTDIFRLLSVSEGMENDLVIQEQYPDVITSLIQNVEEHDTKLLEFSGLDTRVTDIENNVNELKGDLSQLSEEIAGIKQDGTGNSGGISTNAKRSILYMFSKVAHFNEDISEYYETLANEFGLYNIKYDLTNVSSSNVNLDIEANGTFTTIIIPKNGYILDSIVVTMGGADITETVYNIETSIITIEQVTGDVMITAKAVQELMLYNWDFTQSLVDTVEGKEAKAASQATVPTIDENGMTFDSSGKRVKILNIMDYNRTYEIDFSTANYQNGAVNAILCGFALETGGSPQSCIAYRKTGNWNYFDNTANTWGEGGTHSDANLISGKTLKITVDADGIMSAYVDDELICKSTVSIDATRTLFLFGSQSNGYYSYTVTGMRVYDGVR